MNCYKKIRKFRRDVRAISPIISTLLLIAIAVVAALVTYAWVMGYIGFQTGKTGSAIQIQSVDFAGKMVYVENVGTGTVQFADPCLYINGAEAITGTNAATVYTAGQTAALAVPAGVTFTSGTTYTFKVTTTGGTFNQITLTAP